jgi:hypothetical protein
MHAIRGRRFRRRRRVMTRAHSVKAAIRYSGIVGRPSFGCLGGHSPALENRGAVCTECNDEYEADHKTTHYLFARTES